MKHLAAILAISLCIPLSGCDTLQALQSKPAVQFAETQVIRLAQAYFSNGGKVDTMWGISEGLNFAGDIATFAAQQRQAATTDEANRLAALKLKETVKSFADNKTAVTGLANGIASVMDNSKATTPAQRAEITLKTAATLQKVATTMP